jgi:hypothetical protein
MRGELRILPLPKGLLLDNRLLGNHLKVDPCRCPITLSFDYYVFI